MEDGRLFGSLDRAPDSGYPEHHTTVVAAARLLRIRRKGVMGGKKNPKKLTQTNAWRGAEFDFAGVVVSARMPFLGESLNEEQIDKRMAAILEDCPRFYPALLHRGLCHVSNGGGKKAESFLDRGFELVIELLEGEELVDVVDELIEGLENRFRYDLCCRYLKKLAEMYPERALYYDYWAGNELKRRNGSVEEARKLQEKALQLEPNNPTFYNNLGWIHLTAGELEDAEHALEKALSIKPEHDSARANMEVLHYLRKQSGGARFMDFLLRPIDHVEIRKLEDAEEWDELDPIIADYNQSRMEAFKQTLLEEGDYLPHQIWNFKTTLGLFFAFIDKTLQDVFLFDDLTTVHQSFKAIMHRFIFKHRDVDDEIVDDIYTSLALFCSFLSRRKLAADHVCRDFLRDIDSMKPELLEKMHRYNEIRHDDSMSEEEKEEIRDELFEGDHWFPL